MPRAQVKIINGSEHVFDVEEAARRLTGLGLRLTERESLLSIPYEIDSLFACGARNPDSSIVLEVKGTYPALNALGEKMEA